MAAIFAYTCSCCGQRHEGSPSFGFAAPLHYDQLPADERGTLATLDGDTCTIAHPGATDRFVRAVLALPIHGVAQPFLWGVWVSLGEDSFARCTGGGHDPSDRYFGWLSNRLPHYPDTVNLKTNLHPRRDGARPWLVLEPGDHPLAVHFRHGMRVDEAQAIAEIALHGAR